MTAVQLSGQRLAKFVPAWWFAFVFFFLSCSLVGPVFGIELWGGNGVIKYLYIRGIHGLILSAVWGVFL